MKKALLVAAPVVPALLLILVYLGDTFRHSVISVSVFFALLALLSVFALVTVEGDQGSQPIASGRFAVGQTAWWIRGAGVLGLGLLCLILSGQRYQHMVIFPKDTPGLWVAAAVAAGCLVVLVAKPPKPLISLFLLGVAGLAVRCLWFSAWEINPAKRDMLPLVISAIERFVSFENPYGFHQMQRGSEVPLTYPPGLWLAHLPAYLAGIDIRWTAWLSDAVIIACLGGYAVRRRSATVGPLFLALAGYLFLPDIHWNGIYAEPHADWAVLTALAVAVLSGRPLSSGLLFGLALTTRPFNLVLLPFFAVWLYRQFGVRKAWETALVSGGVAACFYLPFVLWDPDAFFVGTVRWLLAYGPAHHTWFHGKMSFSGILYLSHLAHLMAPAQIAALLITTGVAFWRLKTSRHLVVFWTVMYAIFVSFNAIVWMSFWIGVCLLAAALTAAAGDPETAVYRTVSAPSWREPPWGRRLIDIGASMGIAAALSVMLVLLYRHFDTGGLDRVARYVSEQLRPGDLVVDNTGYRKAILKTPFLLSGDDLPKQVSLGTSLFRAVLPRRRPVDLGEIHRIFAVERFGLFDERGGVLTGSGVSASGPFVHAKTQQFDRYRLHLFKRRERVVQTGRLSERPASISIRAVTDAGRSEGRLEREQFRFDRSAGRVRAGRQQCRIDGVSNRMLYISPLAAVTLEIAFPVADVKWISVLGGLPDRNAAWHRPLARASVAVDDRRLGDVRFPNLSGMRGTTFEVPVGAREAIVEITTAKNANPKLCIDVLFWGEKSM